MDLPARTLGDDAASKVCATIWEMQSCGMLALQPHEIVEWRLLKEDGVITRGTLDDLSRLDTVEYPVPPWWPV